jgi:hypothetical protein
MTQATARTIALDPVDWFWAPWRRPAPLVRPSPEPFALAACLARLESARAGRQKRWDWTKAGLAPALTDEEAHFWFEAMLSPPHWSARERAEHLKGLAPQLGKRPLNLGRLRDNLSQLRPEIMVPLAHFLPSDTIFELFLLGEAVVPEDPPFAPSSGRFARSVLRDGFRRYLLPYLDEEQRFRLQLMLRGRLDLAAWPSDRRSVPIIFSLAASLGMDEELLPLVQSWPDNDAERRTFVFQNNERQNVIFGLDGPEAVLHHLRRLRLRPLQPEHARAWLAHAGLEALDWMRDTIRALPKADQANRVLEAMCLVQAPEAAPHMLALKCQSQVPRLARRWLDENVPCAIAGLVPVASGRGPLAEAARDYLADAVRLGHREAVEREVLHLSPTSASRVMRELPVERALAPFPDERAPAWLREALEEAPAKLDRPPEWLRPEQLPPIVVAKRCLNDTQRRRLLAALRESSAGEPHPLVAAVAQHAERCSLSDFAWKLLQAWLDDGMPSAGAWALTVAGFFGDDQLVCRLAPLLAGWQQERELAGFALSALNALSAIGTDTALLHLVGVARQTSSTVPMRARANGLLDAVAARRGLRREQLEDTLLPGPGAQRAFDYGARQFYLMLDERLKPRLLDCSGRVRKRLPRPRKRETSQAGTALRQWRALEQNLRPAVKLHRHRLEEAMIAGRGWSQGEFESLLGHPVLGVLARGLVWGGYDNCGVRVWTFHVDAEGGCSDLKGGACPTGVDLIGIVHPVELTKDERAAWFGAIKGSQPVSQLGRPVVRLSPEDADESEVSKHGHLGIPASYLWRTLRKQKWERPGGMGVSGWGYVKRFAGVTAVLELEGRGPLGRSGRYDFLSVCRCYFLDERRSGGFSRPLRLVEVDPVAVSEALSDLELLASKAQPMPAPERKQAAVLATAGVWDDDPIPF